MCSIIAQDSIMAIARSLLASLVVSRERALLEEEKDMLTSMLSLNLVYVPTRYERVACPGRFSIFAGVDFVVPLQQSQLSGSMLALTVACLPYFFSIIHDFHFYRPLLFGISNPPKVNSILPFSGKFESLSSRGISLLFI